MTNSISLKIIDGSDSKSLNQLNELLKQWSTPARVISPEYFPALTKQSHLVGVYDNDSLVGTATLVPIYKLSGLKGSIEHVLVDEKYRGQGLGEQLMRFCINHAKEIGMKNLFLTVDPDRLAAQKLYEKLGFEKQDTYFYEIKL